MISFMFDTVFALDMSREPSAKQIVNSTQILGYSKLKRIIATRLRSIDVQRTSSLFV